MGDNNKNFEKFMQKINKDSFLKKAFDEMSEGSEEKMLELYDEFIRFLDMVNEDSSIRERLEKRTTMALEQYVLFKATKEDIEDEFESMGSDAQKYLKIKKSYIKEDFMEWYRDFVEACDYRIYHGEKALKPLKAAAKKLKAEVLSCLRKEKNERIIDIITVKYSLIGDELDDKLSGLEDEAEYDED